MAAELRDLRVKITIETDVWLEAEARTTGRDKPEIVRDLLHRHAETALHKANLLSALAASEGIVGQEGAKRR